MENILEAKDISISFGGVKAVQHLSFDIHKGEILGLIGPNGSAVVEVDYTMKKGAENRPLTNLQNIAGLMAFVLTAAALMFSGQLGLESWQCTIMGALAMIFFGVLKPKEAGKALPIGMLMLIVGSNGISNALSSTGAG